MNNEPLVMSVDENGHRTQTGDRGIAALRKLPAACSEELQPCESLPAACSEELQPCESFLQLAAGNRNVRKLPAACSGKSQRAKLPKVIVN